MGEQILQIGHWINAQVEDKTLLTQ